MSARMRQDMEIWKLFIQFYHVQREDQYICRSIKNMTVEMVLMFLFYLNFPNNLMKKEKAYKKATIDRLINTKYISEMKTLYLPNENLECQDLQKITKSPKLREITNIKLSKNPLGAMGGKLVALSPWTCLTNIELKCCNLGPKGVKFLLQGEWPDLTQLRLGWNHIGDEGMSHLSKGQWKKLSKLWLQGNHIGVKGIVSLTKMNLSELSKLKGDNKFNAESAKEVTKMGLKLLDTIDIVEAWNKNSRVAFMKNIITDRFPTIKFEE